MSKYRYDCHHNSASNARSVPAPMWPPARRLVRRRIPVTEKYRGITCDDIIYLSLLNTPSLVCCGTCTGYWFRKEFSFDLQCLTCAIITTRRLHISLMISHWWSPSDWWSGITASTTVRFFPTPDRSSNSAQHHWRSIVSCDCRTCMEQSSVLLLLLLLYSLTRHPQSTLFPSRRTPPFNPSINTAVYRYGGIFVTVNYREVFLDTAHH